MLSNQTTAIQKVKNLRKQPDILVHIYTYLDIFTIEAGRVFPQRTPIAANRIYLACRLFPGNTAYVLVLLYVKDNATMHTARNWEEHLKSELIAN